MTHLTELHTEIDNRVTSIRSHTPDWLCGKGCAGCCRSLAQVPQLTATEWALLQKGLAALAPERLAEIREKVAALAQQATRPVVCPLLEEATNACPVYAQRPVACRTYGFYVQRELGLYCAGNRGAGGGRQASLRGVGQSRCHRPDAGRAGRKPCADRVVCAAGRLPNSLKLRTWNFSGSLLCFFALFVSSCLRESKNKA